MTATSRAATPSGMVTPEAVVLEFETAGVASRTLSGAIDGVVQILLLVVVVLAGAGLDRVGLELGGVGIALVYLALFLVLFAYPAGCETLWRGRTVGKLALGLRVVTVEGGPVRFRHAAIRAILGLVDKFALSGTVGIVALLVTRRNQRLGDLVAGTIVLRERSGAQAPQAVRFSPPPGLESYVALLDVSRLGHQDYGAVRSFLLRAAKLTPTSRWSLAVSLATPLRERLRTTPPSGLPPEVFLACVAAAYQARHRPAAPAGPTIASVWADPQGSRLVATGGGAGPPAAAVRAATGFEAPG